MGLPGSQDLGGLPRTQEPGGRSSRSPSGAGPDSGMDSLWGTFPTWEAEEPCSLRKSQSFHVLSKSVAKTGDLTSRCPLTTQSQKRLATAESISLFIRKTWARPWFQASGGLQCLPNTPYDTSNDTEKCWKLTGVQKSEGQTNAGIF